jgi:hypothetical protein
VWHFVKMACRGQSFVAQCVYSAVRELRNPKAYLRYPGSTPKPAFAPAEFGTVAWIDKSRSPLAERLLPHGGSQLEATPSLALPAARPKS